MYANVFSVPPGSKISSPKEQGGGQITCYICEVSYNVTSTVCDAI